MKKLPLTLIPAILLVLVVALFKLYVPAGEDLISETGDTVLGIFVGVLLGVCLVLDIKRYKYGR